MHQLTNKHSLIDPASTEILGFSISMLIRDDLPADWNASNRIGIDDPDISSTSENDPDEMPSSDPTEGDRGDEEPVDEEIPTELDFDSIAGVTQTASLRP